MEHDVGGADRFSNLFYRDFLRVIYLSWVLDFCLQGNIILMSAQWASHCINWTVIYRYPRNSIPNRTKTMLRQKPAHE